MKKNKFVFGMAAAAVLSVFVSNLRAADLPGVPRDSNFNNTGG